jgi:hypothetical protein
MFSFRISCVFNISSHFSSIDVTPFILTGWHIVCVVCGRVWGSECVLCVGEFGGVSVCCVWESLGE